MTSQDVFFRVARAAYRLPFFRRAVPASLQSRLRARLEAGAMRRLPDRRYMERQILPAMAALQPARVLFVGVERYTRHYARWFAAGVYWTLDIQPEVARWGAPGRHITGSVLEADNLFAPQAFDIVLLNGVFGYGVDAVAEQEATVRALSALLRTGGVLVLGWNDDRVRDPLQLPPLAEGFTHGIGHVLPARQRFNDSTHVYDFFRRK